MTNKEAWEKFDIWFEKEGHWAFGTNGKTKAEEIWRTRGIDASMLPDYPGERHVEQKEMSYEYDSSMTGLVR
jgi:hypothetical protein